MKKDKDWLSEQVGDLNSTDAVFNENGVSYIDTAVSIESVYDLIYQLDEPEVLSQEWIDKHKYIYDNIQVVGIKDLQNLLVPKQELPVIPKFVAEWIDACKDDGFSLYGMFDSMPNEVANWMIDSKGKGRSKGQDSLARAWLDGFRVEEQKYYVLDSELVPLLERANNQTYKTTTDLSIFEDGRDNSQFALTEQEIKDYDERFWAFAVPVEEVEE